MKKEKLIFGIITIVLGLLIALGPRTLFPVCSSEEMTMTCHYTAQGELALGGVITVLGILLLTAQNPLTAYGLALTGIPVGVAVILVPTALIGVCPNIHMGCHSLTLPVLVVLGVLQTLLSLVAALLLKRHHETP